MKISMYVPVKATVDGVSADALVFEGGVDSEAIVFQGGAVKAAGIKDGFGTLSGYGVVFSTPGENAERDLSGQYFTKSTYFGPRDGDGADGAFHHTLPIKGIEFAAEHLFAPVKTHKDDIGLFTEIVLDMSDAYERAVYKMGEAGKLGFSSGTASHMIRCAADGEIKRWPIVEISLTPTPCEPRARATAMKALEAQSGDEAMAVFAGEFKAIFESQEQAEDAFVEAVEVLGDQYQENSRQAELISIQREALLMHAEILRRSVLH